MPLPNPANIYVGERKRLGKIQIVKEPVLGVLKAATHHNR